ncbi:Vacuolar protein sorting-associated protein 51 -like protein [Trametes pubescens]|uniref:Vacuolar protein sorting-associated protein 51 homolog n=1 Tax=Trametes pubescens TaxID=154538 RepID=A0A1M2VHX4_TRAPU|nr:Vacuolar protein sorting-associated protein 51 -like protein [Trametes pubescens]
MSLNPTSSPPRTPYSPHTPLTPHTPHTPGTPSRAGSRTPTQSARPPPTSPLRRPSSPSSLRAAPGAVQPASSQPRRTSGSLTSVGSVGMEARGGPVGVQKTRARELLRKHYGLGLGPPPPLGGAKSNQDPMDFDSPAFDARAYYEQLITTSSLPTLLKTENDLLTEIRQLDSERQSLVYNHHHELIAASDTIAAMKSRAENLDTDLDLLRAAFSEISRLSADISVEHHSPADDYRQDRPPSSTQ